MAIRSDEISEILRRQIASMTPTQEMSHGTVIRSATTSPVAVAGCRAGELLKFANGVIDMVMNLEEDSIGCIVMGADQEIRKATGSSAQAGSRGSVGEPMRDSGGCPGNADRRQGPHRGPRTRTIEYTAPTVMERQPVTEPMQTGLKAIDALVPIGRGQRELIIGDRQTGKTAIALDAMLNQKDTDVYCIYVAIGQKANSVAGLVATLAETGVLKCVVVAMVNEPPSISLAPYAGCAIAEDGCSRATRPDHLR